MADHPLRPATDRRLGRPLPHQLANPTSAAPITRGRFQSPAFPLRTYAVLAWLSPGYPPLQDAFRCVTHPFATRHQGCPRAAVRLACVKHSASVQSEPGSNSSVQFLLQLQLIKNHRVPTCFTKLELLLLSMSTQFPAIHISLKICARPNQVPTPIGCFSC